MHYFNVRCLKKTGSVVLLQATLVHPDIDTFGTERLFAWKLLSDFVSPDDDGDDVTLARKYIKHVEVGPLAHGTVNKRGRGWFSITRATEDVDDEDAERPAVVYTIEVSDPSLLAQLEEGDSEESLAYVEHDKVILVETSAGPANAPGKAKANKAKASKAKETTTRARSKATKDASDRAASPREAKSYDDLRNACFELIRDGRHWPDAIIAFLVRWAEDASDEQVMAWLEEFSVPGTGRLGQVAGRVAVQRVLAGKLDSARRFATAGEAALPADDKAERARAIQGGWGVRCEKQRFSSLRPCSFGGLHRTRA